VSPGKAGSHTAGRATLRIIGAALLAVALICFLAGILADHIFPVMVGVFLAIPGALFFMMSFYGSHERSVWLRLYALDYRECASCHEPLEGLPDGPCPRCKIHFTGDSLRTKYPKPPSGIDPDEAMEHAGWIPGKGPARNRRLELTSPWAFGVLLTVTIGGFAMLLLSHRIAGQPTATVLGIVSQLVYITGLAFTMVAWRNRKAARVIALDFRICTRCGFDLRGLPSPGLCPECNRAFTADALRIRWLSKFPIAANVDFESTKERWLRDHPGDRAVRVQAASDPRDASHP